MATSAVAESIILPTFGGLNNSADPAAIANHQSPDLLNVDLSPAGNLRKRDGFTGHLVGYSTVSVSSAFIFKNQSGDEILMFTNGSDVWRSANAGAATVLTTVTYQARLYCQNAEGTAYCFTSENDLPWKYNGTTRTQTQTTSYPNGKFNVFTQDRQLIAGTTDQPNRLYISKSASYQDFTGGNDLVSSWTEDIGTNGDRITALSYLNGRVIAWKEYSIAGFNLTDQFNSVMYNISNDIGISGPESLIQRFGLIYFKGSDNEFYTTDGAPGNINMISAIISSTTASLFSGKNRSNIQTDKADWDEGDLKVAGPGAPMATNIIVGSVLPSSATFLDTTGADFALGTLGDLTTTYTKNSLRITTAPFIISNGDFETGALSPWNCWTQAAGDACSVNAADAISGTYGAQVVINCSPGPFAADVNLLDGGTTVYTLTYAQDSAILPGRTLDLAALGFSTRTLSMSFQISANNTNTAILRSSTFTAISSITWGGASGSDCPSSNVGWDKLDNVKVNRYYAVSQASQPFSYHSQIFNTGFSTTTGGTFTVSMASTPATAITFQVRSASSSSGAWGAWAAITNTDRITQTKQYWQYQSSFTVYATTETVPKIDDSTLIAATTGQYITQCIQPGPGITSWGIISAGGATNGNAGLTYALQTGDACSSLGTFTAISTGAVPSGAVKAALKIRTTFDLPSATNTARLDELIVNWAEGSVSSPTYGIYWNDGLYWSVQTSTGGNNYMLKYDLNYGEWFIFDIPANPLLSFNNSFYFGSSKPPGNIYKFSNYQASDAPTSDNGAVINAYWRSKDFTGSDPFVENGYDAINLLLRRGSGGSATVTWRANGGDTGSSSYTVGLSTGTNVVRSNYKIPVGTRGTFFSIEVGNNSTTPFEVLGARIDLKPLPYRPIP